MKHLLDETSTRWNIDQMKHWPDETPSRWNIDQMKHLLDETLTGWKMNWMKHQQIKYWPDETSTRWNIDQMKHWPIETSTRWNINFWSFLVFLPFFVFISLCLSLCVWGLGDAFSVYLSFSLSSSVLLYVIFLRVSMILKFFRYPRFYEW